MRTCASIFGGFGGFESGAEAAGLRPVWTVEMDSDIAGVHAMNFPGSQVIISRAQDVDYSRLASPFRLHASNECKRASVANADGEESEEDISQARAVERALIALQPPQFSLENVWAYRNFESFKIICRALKANGYAFDYWHLNCADYGVPQTRKRLILLASKTHKPHRPQTTHREHGDMFLPKWNGWYEAIEDLIPTLPESKFANWQLKRLPAQMPHAFLGAVQGEASDIRERDEPSPVITTAHGAAKYRAFIVDGFNSSHENISRQSAEPMWTLTANNGAGRLNPIRAFIVHGTSTMEVRGESEPSACVMATVGAKAARPRPFILDGRNTRTTDNEPFTIREGREPFFSVTASDGSERHRAFIEGIAQRQSGLFAPEPAWLAYGRVVSMTPRALARFQSFPDDFQLPDKNSLACKGIGNALPPLLAQRFIESEMRAALDRAA